MRPVTNGLIVSRRNLLSLLAKLDGAPNGSFCEIVFRHPDSAPFHLYAEEDAVHYAHPSRLGSPPGEMHEDTERQISQAEFRANQTFLARAYITRVAHRDMGYGEAERGETDAP